MASNDLKAKLWHAANIMRRDDGTNGINEYIEQISWMTFLKVFEDVEKRFADNAKLENKKYTAIIPKKFSWSSWTTMDTKEIIDFINEELFPKLSSLSGTKEKNTIGLIFSEVRYNKMKSAANLKDVVDIINKIDFNKEEDSHILSQFYEELLVKLGKESGIAGEFYTPRPVVRFVIKLVNPKLDTNNEIKIIDPFCGSCGFLVETYNHLKKGKINSKTLSKIEKTSFFGYEKKSLPFLVGFMNCILHELLTPNIERRNSLNDNILKFGVDEKFDYVFTNPPFGGAENKQIQQNFPIKASATELLSLQQVMKRLKPEGECGIVVPDGLLSRPKAFATVKEDLIKNFNVHTIISLSPGVFANVTSSGQGPKTSLLFFNRKGITKRIWYYEQKPPNGKSYSKVNTIQDEHLEECYKKWMNLEESENSWFVNIDELDENYDLAARNPNKKDVVEKRTPEEIIDKIISYESEISKTLTKIRSSL